MLKEKCIILCAVIFLIISCRKIEKIEKNTNDQLQKFFAVNNDIDPRLRAIIEDLKIKNQSTEFVSNLLNESGQPIWHKNLFEVKSSQIIASSNSTTNNTQE